MGVELVFSVERPRRGYRNIRLLISGSEVRGLHGAQVKPGTTGNAVLQGVHNRNAQKADLAERKDSAGTVLRTASYAGFFGRNALRASRRVAMFSLDTSMPSSASTTVANVSPRSMISISAMRATVVHDLADSTEYA